MGFGRNILMRAFGRPRGLLGRVGGQLMARLNRRCAEWAIGLLDVRPDDAVLEVGFGPGVAVQLLTRAAPEGRVAGVDPSEIMLAQARARNADVVPRGRVDLRLGGADRLPWPPDSFDKALAINSLQVWPDPDAGLREIRRVLKPGGRIALAFTPYSGQPKEGLRELLTANGFTEARVVEGQLGFGVLAGKE